MGTSVHFPGAKRLTPVVDRLPPSSVEAKNE